jgi:hypothetical protein
MHLMAGGAQRAEHAAPDSGAVEQDDEGTGHGGGCSKGWGGQFSAEGQRKGLMKADLESKRLS